MSNLEPTSSARGPKGRITVGCSGSACVTCDNPTDMVEAMLEKMPALLWNCAFWAEVQIQSHSPCFRRWCTHAPWFFQRGVDKRLGCPHLLLPPEAEKSSSFPFHLALLGPHIVSVTTSAEYQAYLGNDFLGET